MRSLWFKIRAAWFLGVQSVLRVARYRCSLLLRINSVVRLRVPMPIGPFFRRPTIRRPISSGVDRWTRDVEYFGWFKIPLRMPTPDWFLNPFNGARYNGAGAPWWKLPDFGADAGDIKAIWELSRWNWVVAYALNACSGSSGAIDRLNQWIDDWCHCNPPFLGPNWKCGQEAAIRVIHLALAAKILGQVEGPSGELLNLVRVHLRRIEPTLEYAVGQDNNHGTSEAAALFIGGSWLRVAADDRQGEKWEALGRKWLEERIGRLIAEDGSFSQYSTNYHRLLLDTMSLAEAWRREMDAPDFSSVCASRCRAAVSWLRSFVDPDSGDVPNSGANDGAWLIPFGSTDPRDFRPSVQLGAALFLGRAAYPEGSWNEILRLLELSIPEMEMAPAESTAFDDGGFACLCAGTVRAFVRYPRFRFRPSHADALHVDLWVDGENLLRDGGTFSYAAGQPDCHYFPGTASHNTIQFDDRDQMPRLSRFLFGEWLRSRDVRLPVQAGGKMMFSASYRDWLGAEHRRSVELGQGRLFVEDRVSGFRRKAVLRWRLAPGTWRQDGQRCTNGRVSIDVSADVSLSRMELVTGWESRYYLKKEPIPVIEVESPGACVFKTTILW